MAFEVQKRYVLSLFKISSGKPLVYHKQTQFTYDNTKLDISILGNCAYILSLGGKKLLLLLRPFFTHLKHKILEASWLELVVGAVTFIIQNPKGHANDDFN